MNRSKSRKIIAVFVMLAVLTAGTTAAFAYFTDYEDARGGAVLTLESESELHEIPEDDKKTISVQNTGYSDIIVRISVFGSFVTVEADESDWVQDGDYWYYKHILGPGESTSDIIARIDTGKAAEAGHDFDVVVVHESERVTYDDTDENRVVKPEGWAYPDITVAGQEEVDG
ncbi:MAG: hypothetical protein IKF54_05165 [Eubacterium sp.]|nr:hypothetical protein [Eubacterium sp.]